ncbi:hypothetical protein EHS25_004417 [Saitozyma podzolica]|uniref:BAR domain-containing protein n=1 Tax=Saitozyma podzolica TaxID=1890683 RepID=A0A427YTZ5_9TREE|nr:hypothetical protein EHS25_004417 [Saitozyma podzolica]
MESMKSQASSVAWPRPPSPSFSTTTTGSRINLPAAHALITRKDLRQSIACFEDLMAAAKAYRNALLAMSSATAAFASAMEACSRVKGCRSANAGLAGTSGLQFLVANHEQLLADAVYRQFEIPLLEALDHYKLVTADRLAAYEKNLHDQSGRIRKTEAENLKVARRRKRDLQSFRAALAELQRQVDELDAIKAAYHEEVLEGEDEIWDTVLGKVAFVARSQLDFYEKLAGKASDPILEPLVMSIPDPFDAYGPPKEEGQIFSVLAPLGMLDSPKSPSANLTRTQSSPGTSGRSSPSKPVPFPTISASPSKAETSAVSANGTNGFSTEESDSGRARRELSVIEERDTSDVVSREDGEGKQVRKQEDEPELADAHRAEGAEGAEVAAEEVVSAGDERPADDRPTVDQPDSPESAQARISESRDEVERGSETTVHTRFASNIGPTLEEDEASRWSVAA